MSGSPPGSMPRCLQSPKTRVIHARSIARRSARTTCSRRNRTGGRRWWRVRPAGIAFRLRPRDHPDLRAPRGVPAGGGVHRRRPQGDVRVRGQGRAPHRATPGGHRAGGPELRAAPAADSVEGLVRRTALPLRAPTEGPLPPALAGGRGGARRRGRRCRRRGDRARARVLPRTWSHPTDADAQLDGRRCEQDSIPRGAARALPGARIWPRSRLRGTGRAEPAAPVRHQARRLARRRGTRAAAGRVPERRIGRALRAGAAATRLARDRVRDRATAGAGIRLLQRHHLRVPERSTRRRRTRSAAVAATTSWPRRWVAHPRRVWDSASGSNGC